MPARPRIAVIDDDPVTLGSLVTLLAADYDIRIATTGEGGLALIGRDRPDIVLLDLNLPDISGLEVCGRIKAQPATADIPVLLLTAQSDEGTEVEGLGKGAADFISKPLRGHAILTRLHQQLEARRVQDRLRAESLVDGLTGVGNRQALTRALQCERNLVEMTGEDLALILIDVDHFKAYNDHYGHVAGDHALRAVAGALSRAARRRSDLVMRYGGEEFVILLRATEREGAIRVARAIQAEVASLGLPHAASPTAEVLTVSQGLAILSPATPGTDAEELIRRADAALYCAKEAGRNRFALEAPAGQAPC